MKSWSSENSNRKKSDETAEIIYIGVRNSTEREAQNVGSKFVYVCQYAHPYVFSRPVDTKNSFGRFVCFNLAVEQNKKREETVFFVVDFVFLYLSMWLCAISYKYFVKNRRCPKPLLNPKSTSWNIFGGLRKNNHEIKILSLVFHRVLIESRRFGIRV